MQKLGWMIFEKHAKFLQNFCKFLPEKTVQIWNVFAQFENGSDDCNTVRDLTYMTFTHQGLPKAQPCAYIETIIAISSQLQLKLKAEEKKIADLST